MEFSVVCTRIHRSEQAGPVSEDFATQVQEFVTSSSLYSKGIAIAVDATDLLLLYALYNALFQLIQSEVLERMALAAKTAADQNSVLIGRGDSSFRYKSSVLYIVHIANWVRFVGPLNSLLTLGISEGYRVIGFVSLEVAVDDKAGAKLVNLIANESDTLVVGARLQGHAFFGSFEGRRAPLNGLTSPWNTCAFWDLETLSKTGFLKISDGIYDGETGSSIDAGVEEVAAINVLQKLLNKRHKSQALVVEFTNEASSCDQNSCPELPINDYDKNKYIAKATEDAGHIDITHSSLINWRVEFGGDLKRIEWHRHKMASKYQRAQAQQSALNLALEGETNLLYSVTHKKINI
eukprot:Nk52_evm26s311 gene=Nk52_evmTU26s311